MPLVSPATGTVLITGASGVLGGALLRRVPARGYALRATSRRPVAAGAGVQWVGADLVTGDGLDAAVAGVDTIVHAASNPRADTERTDVEGTRRLLAAARRAGVRHVVYVSIVGIDRVPYPYYRHKLAAEEVVRGADVPWTILRGTQFHDLIDSLFRRFTRFPIGSLPKSWLSQPVHVDEFAEGLWACVAAGPRGRAPDVAGPEVLRLGEMMRAWLAARRLRKLVLNLPLFGPTAAALKRGYATAPDRAVGRVTWGEWLRAKYSVVT